MKKSTVAPIPSSFFVIERDSADEVFVNLAIETNADYLVSRDRDLLDLRLDSEFTSNFPFLKIVDTFEFLQIVRAN